MPPPDPQRSALVPPLQALGERSLRRPVPWWITFVGWNAALFWLSSISGERLPALMPMIPQFDKVEHAGFYAVGFGLFTVALSLTRRRAPGVLGVTPGRGLFGVAVLAAAVCGGLDEWHQTFTPHRSGLDLGDWTADVFGGTLGTLTAFWWLHTFARLRASDSGSGVGGSPEARV